MIDDFVCEGEVSGGWWRSFEYMYKSEREVDGLSLGLVK